MSRSRPVEIGSPTFVNHEVERVEDAWLALRRRDRRTSNAWQPWKTWRHTNAEIVEAVRSSLTNDWTVMWDRNLPGWQTPATLVVGPPVPWALWVAPPGYRGEAWQPLADCFAQLLPDWAVRSYVTAADTWTGQWRRFVAELAIFPSVILSPGDRRRLIEYLTATTGDQVNGIPAKWPARIPNPAGDQSKALPT